MRTAAAFACPEPPDRPAPAAAPAMYAFAHVALACDVEVFVPGRADLERRARILAQTLRWWAAP